MAVTPTSLADSVIPIALERPALAATRRGRRERLTRATLPYFLAGPENRLAAHVATADENVIAWGNPVLICGPTGAGKTAMALHLAARQAIAGRNTDRDAGSIEPDSVSHQPSVDFARAYAQAVEADDLPPFRRSCTRPAILIVDDLHLIADKPTAQEELAMRIDERVENGQPTIVTSRLFPSEVKGLRSTLTSRLVPGLTVTLAYPRDATRSAVLRELAIHANVDVDDGLLSILDDGLDAALPVRTLDSAVRQLDLQARMNDRDIDVRAVQAVIDQHGHRDEISPAAITTAVARHFRLRSAELKSASRQRTIVRARSLAMYLIRQMTGKSMHQIGDYFGGRDHTTVMHAIRKIEGSIDDDLDLRRVAGEISEKLTGGQKVFFGG